MANILVVDDTSFMRLAIKKIIEPMGHSIVEAKDGNEAISQFTAFKPELTIMDITMDGMDGITALKEIKKLDSSAKVLMCSAMGQQSKVVEAIEAGASSFIVKPFDNAKFEATVKSLLEK